MWSDAKMRFIVKTDNDLKYARMLNKFNSEFQHGALTVDLNSWHAFTALRSLFVTAPIIDNQSSESEKYIGKRPMLDFRTRERGRLLKYRR